QIGLGRRPREAKAFYATLAGATLIGTMVNFTSVNPIKALFWSTVLNGIIAVPMMFVMMHMASSKRIMGAYTTPVMLRALGWFSTFVMTIVVGAMFVTML
nr:divalent metal cation transporter [Pseudomonadota bacterium]